MVFFEKVDWLVFSGYYAHMNRTQFQVQLPVIILKEGKRFVAYSPVVDLSTSGTTKQQAQRRFGEMLSLFFEGLIQRNTLDEVLTGLGWRKVRRLWEPPVIVSHNTQKIAVAV